MYTTFNKNSKLASNRGSGELKEKVKVVKHDATFKAAAAGPVAKEPKVDIKITK